MSVAVQSPTDVRRDAVGLLYKFGCSFVRLHEFSKKPIDTGWPTLPRETLETALQWADHGNIGIRTGQVSGGLVVVDADLYNGADISGLDLPPTVTVETGRGGKHFYYTANRPVKNSTGKIGRFIDTKGDGGQVVAPGSLHPDTNRLYRWAPGHSPSEIEIAPLPDWIYKALENGSGKKNGDAYGKVALERESATVRGAAEGTRNDQLNKSAFNLGQLVAADKLPLADAEIALTQAAHDAGLPDAEIKATLASGLKKGMLNPRAPANPRTEPPATPPADVGDPTPHDLRALLASPPDPAESILGNRWLCRGRTAILTGQTGIGKSSFLIQASVLWALGRDFCGLKPNRPLTTSILENENGDGDLREMLGGVFDGLQLTAAEQDEVFSRLFIYSESSKRGDAFLDFARRVYQRDHSDLIIPEPLFAVMDGDVSDARDVGRFLRGGLGSIGQDTGVAFLISHHVPKPSRNPDVRQRPNSYSAHGSAELSNYPRALIHLEEVGDRTYELKATKRSGRAGFVDSFGQPTTSVLIEHDPSGRIFWRRAFGAESAQDDADQDIVTDIYEEIEPGKKLSRADVRRLVEKTMGVKRSTVLTRGRPACRVFNALLNKLYVPEKPGTYIKSVTLSQGVT